MNLDTLYPLMVVELSFTDGHKASYALINPEAIIPKFIVETIMEISKCDDLFFMGDLATIRKFSINKNEVLHGKRQGYRRTKYSNIQINHDVNIQYDITPEPFILHTWE